LADRQDTVFHHRTTDGVRVRVRLTPAGRHDGIDGLMTDVDGHGVLKASVTRAPEDGKANTALIKMLANQWKVAKSTLEVVQGASARNKVLQVCGDPQTLDQTIAAWAKAQNLS